MSDLLLVSELAALFYDSPNKSLNLDRFVKYYDEATGDSPSCRYVVRARRIIESLLSCLAVALTRVVSYLVKVEETRWIDSIFI